LLQGLTHSPIEVAGWLIGEHDRWRIHQSPRDSHPLLLPAGKFTRPMVQPIT
jgi:hypothetical protein